MRLNLENYCRKMRNGAAHQDYVLRVFEVSFTAYRQFHQLKMQKHLNLYF